MIIRNTLLSLFVLGGGLVSHAANAGGPAVRLPPVDVAASPIVGETRVSPFGFQTTTIGSEQIAALNAQDVAAALRRTPGAAIARYNPIGAFGGGEGGAVFLRGLGSSRPGGELKTTLEGVPIGNAVFNHPLLDLLALDLASGVQVSRRAEPLAQGSGFAGINLLAPRVAASGSFVRGQLSVGSFGAVGERLEAGVRADRGELYAGQSFRRADGHRADADGRLANVLVRGAWQPLRRLELSYLVHFTDNEATDPGATPGSGLPASRGDTYETRGWTHLAAAAWSRDRGEGGLKLYLGESDADWHRRNSSGNADSLNESRLSGVRWRETQRPWENGEVIAGIDLDWTKGRTRSVPAGVGPVVTFGPEQFRLASGYAGVRHTMELGGEARFTPSMGFRYHRHQWFGDAWSPQWSGVVERGPWQMHASFSRAMSFPGLEVAAFSVVAIPALGQTWRTLGPERMEQLEAGVRYEITPEAVLDFTVFRNRGQNRFVFVPPPPPPFRFENLESVRTEGAELTLTARPVSSLSLFGGASTLEATPNDLPYAPRWALVGGATWRIWSFLTLSVDGSRTSAQFAGSQARAAGGTNTERIPAATLLNGRLAYEFTLQPLGKSGTLFLAAENILNREYSYRPGYPMPGIGFTLGVGGEF